MKKFISIALLLALCLGLFAGCTTEQPQPTENPLVNAKNYLFSMYRDTEGVVRRGFERVSVVMIDGVKYTVTWTSDAGENVVITAGETTTKIDINENPAEDVNFKLTATITDASGKSESVSFSHIIEAVAVSGTTFVDAPKAGTPYKFALQHNGLDTPATLYFTGEMNGNYLATTQDPAAAIDVIVEETTGGYYITFTKDGAKKYVNITTYVNDKGETKKTQKIEDAPACVYTWDAERKTMVTELESIGKCYLGCYGTYTTISTSEFKYIEDVSKVGDSQFPAGFATVVIAGPSFVDSPKAGTTYKFGLQHNGLSTPAILYFTGEMNGNYLATSESGADAVDVVLEETTGGYYITFTKDGAKKYVNITTYVNDKGETKKTQKIEDAPACVYTWDAERKTMVTELESIGKCYLGCYGTYTTISTSEFKYIEDVSKVGDSQFPAGFMTGVTASSGSTSGGNSSTGSEPACVASPEVGKTYKLGLWQSNKSEVYYFTGEMSGYYGATETDKSKAVDVVLEDAGDGKYHICFTKDGKKSYLYGEANDTYLNFKFGDTKGVFTWNADNKTFTTMIGDVEVFMGTYSNYVTFGMSKLDKIDTSYAAHLYN